MMELCMKTKLLNLLAFIIILASASVLPAQQVVTATVTVTTPSNIVDTLSSITVNGDTRAWSTNALYGSQIQIPLVYGISQALTNLMDTILLSPFSQVYAIQQGTNAVTLRGYPGVSMSIIIANNWATVSYFTNTLSPAISIRAPVSVAGLSELTNSESAIAYYLGDIYSTNEVPTNAPSLSLWYSWINTHSTGGGSGSNFYSTTNLYVTNTTFNVSGGTNTIYGGTNTVVGGVNTINNFITNDITTNSYSYPTNIIYGGTNNVYGGTTILNGTNNIFQTNTYYTVTNSWMNQLNSGTNGQVFIATGPSSGYWTNSGAVVGGGGGVSLSDVTNVVDWLTVSNSAPQQFTNLANVFVANGYNWGQNIAAPSNTSTVRWFAVTNAGQVWAIPAATWP
jgi:hypothetical protein